MNQVLIWLGLYMIVHLIVAGFRAHLRVTKYQKYYQKDGRGKGAFARGLAKRIGHYKTYLYAGMITLIIYSGWWLFYSLMG